MSSDEGRQREQDQPAPEGAGRRDDARGPADADRYGQYGQSPQYGQYGQYGPAPSQPTPQPQPAEPQAARYGQYGQQPAAAPSQWQTGQPAPQAPWAGQQTQPWGDPQPWGTQQSGWGTSPAGVPQTAPAYGQYGPSAGQHVPRGFGGAAQPGIVPLRPLNVGEILDGGFRAIRANPKVMFGLSLLVMGVTAVIEAVVLALFLGQAIPLLDSAASPEALSALGVGSALGMLATGIGVYVASIVLTALLIVSVSQSVIGRVATVGEVWTNARGQVWRLVGLTLLLGLGWVVVVVAITVLAVLLVSGIVAALGDAAPAVAVIVVLLVVLAAVVGAAFFAVRLTLSAPALMLERTGVMGALKRSWSLTRGHFWRIFGALALAVIIVSVISYALMIPLSLGMAFVDNQMTAMVVTMIVSTVISVLISALTTPFLAAVLALVYIDVRMRKEGLDVELARAAEAR